MDKPLQCFLPDVIHALFGDIASIPNNPDATVDVGILPEFHQCLFSTFLICINSPAKGLPQVVDLKSCCNSLTHWLDQNWCLGGEYHFDIEITKISKGMLFSKEYFSTSLA